MYLAPYGQDMGHVSLLFVRKDGEKMPPDIDNVLYMAYDQ